MSILFQTTCGLIIVTHFCCILDTTIKNTKLVLYRSEHLTFYCFMAYAVSVCLSSHKYNLRVSDPLIICLKNLNCHFLFLNVFFVSILLTCSIHGILCILLQSQISFAYISSAQMWRCSGRGYHMRQND